MEGCGEAQGHLSQLCSGLWGLQDRELEVCIFPAAWDQVPGCCSVQNLQASPIGFPTPTIATAWGRIHPLPAEKVGIGAAKGLETSARDALRPPRLAVV